jgi:alanyl-tRNA synthetase
LHAALRSNLGDTVRQKGSNLNCERMRFEFSSERAMKPDEVKQVEGVVQQRIDGHCRWSAP